MIKVSRKRQKRKLQKNARKIQYFKQKKNRVTGRKLTHEEKIKRKEALAQRNQWKENRKQLKYKNTESDLIKKLHNKISSIFSKETLEELAIQVGFMQRQAIITPFAFIYLLSMGFLGNGSIALPYLVNKLKDNFNVVVTPQAISKRINNRKSVKFTKKVLIKLMESQLATALSNRISEKFSMFSGIFLQDSTQAVLNEKLADGFKGSGGAGSKSALKLDFIFDITKYVINEFTLTEGTVNDQSLSNNILKHIKKNSLVIRDLGYFTLDVLCAIAKKGAYYISRLSIGSYVYANKTDQEPLDLPKHIENLIKQGCDLCDIQVYVGKTERILTRLIVEKVPKHVVEQRGKRFKKDRKKEPSQHYLEWSGFSFFVTNIPQTMWGGLLILEMYKIRWQIELAFKVFKSNVEIHILKGTNENRIENLIYGKLITIVLMFMIQNFAMHVAGDMEVSCDKLTKVLKTDEILQKAILNNGLELFLVYLEYDIKDICKQKRGRPTTLGSIFNQLQQDEWSRKNESITQVHFNEFYNEIYVQNVI